MSLRVPFIISTSRSLEKVCSVSTNTTSEDNPPNLGGSCALTASWKQNCVFPKPLSPVDLNNNEVKLQR